jgi:hypothetical protein
MLILVERRYLQAVIAVTAVTAGHDQTVGTPVLVDAFFTDHSDRVSRPPIASSGGRSSRHGRSMAGSHHASTRDQLSAKGGAPSFQCPARTGRSRMTPRPQHRRLRRRHVYAAETLGIQGRSRRALEITVDLRGMPHLSGRHIWIGQTRPDLLEMWVIFSTFRRTL